jgi:hypothetical protein
VKREEETVATSNREEEEEGRETRTKVIEKEKGKGIVRMFGNIRGR